MYPEENTALYQAGNTKIKLTRDNIDPTIYSYSATLDQNGEAKTFYWHEDATPEQGEEIQIWTYNPIDGGPQPGGSAGGRR